MKHELEALLFATDAPLSMPRLRTLFPEASVKEIKQAIAELETEYEGQERAFTIVEFGGGYQIASRPEYAPLIEKLFRGRRYTRLSQAGLEVLAIVAYRQPITRIEIDEVRGVQSSGALSTLLERNLVCVVGRADTVGHPLLYGTTREFLNHLGLRGLGQLPALPTLEQVINQRDELKAFASQLGRDLSDSDLETYEERNGQQDLADAAEEFPPEAADDSPWPEDLAVDSETDGPEPAPPDAEASPSTADDAPCVGAPDADNRPEPSDPGRFDAS
jgi:segregation and condensation protein B